MTTAQSCVLLAGPANVALATAVADAVGVPLASRDVSRFPDGEIHVELHETVRDADVYLLQPTAPPIETHLLQLLFLVDACRRGGAARVTAVLPYFGYARQDRRASGREAIGARVVADMLRGAGVDRVVAIDLHTTTLEGVFPVPLEHLSAVPLTSRAIHASRDGAPGVVVAPDAGATKLAERWGRLLELPVAFVHKTRLSGEAVATHGVAGSVQGRAPLIVDDMISTGGTMAGAIEAVLAAGATRDVLVAVTHGLFVGPAVERLARLPIRRLIVTDTVGGARPAGLPLEIVSVAPLLADAIGRLHHGRSMSDLILHA